MLLFLCTCSFTENLSACMLGRTADTALKKYLLAV